MSRALTIGLGLIGSGFGVMAIFGLLASPAPCVVFILAAAISAAFEGVWK
jgi:hypothetical protein